VKNFLRKIFFTLKLGIVIFLFAMGFNVLIFQLVYDDLQMVLYGSYVSSSLATFVFVMACDVEIKTRDTSDDILDQPIKEDER
jgi:hypothetical protein